MNVIFLNNYDPQIIICLNINVLQKMNCNKTTSYMMQLKKRIIIQNKFRMSSTVSGFFSVVVQSGQEYLMFHITDCFMQLAPDKTHH